MPRRKKNGVPKVDTPKEAPKPQGFKGHRRPSIRAGIKKKWNTPPVKQLSPPGQWVSTGEEQDLILDFGVHVGEALSAVPIEYLKWLAKEKWVTKYLKGRITNIISTRH